jgi:hypothetical protein
MIDVIMIEASEYKRESYGLLWQSAGVFKASGAGFNNRHHPLRVQVWRDGTCTGNGATHVLNAECIVIANTPVERPAQLGEVAIDDRIRLIYPDGRIETGKLARVWGDDPKLVEVEEIECICTDSNLPARKGCRYCYPE